MNNGCDIFDKTGEVILNLISQLLKPHVHMGICVYNFQVLLCVTAPSLNLST